MIELKGIVKKYGKKTILNNVSIAFKKGEITFLVGRNGAGKSTLMKSVMKLTPLKKGEIFIDGTVGKETKRVSYITDKNTFPSTFTIQNASVYMRDFYQNWNEERANRLLSLFQLDKNQKIATLSKGESMKFNLVIGLSLDVDYFLLDEPFSGLDALSKEELFSIMLDELVGEQGIVITTHDIEEVKYWVDRVVILKDGYVASDFYMEEMLAEDGRSILDIWKEVEGK